MTPAEHLANLKRCHPTRVRIAARETTWRCNLNPKRQELSLTLRDIEGKIGVSNATLSQIERGAETSLLIAMKLCTFFGCTVEEMWPEAVTGEKWPKRK